MIVPGAKSGVSILSSRGLPERGEGDFAAAGKKG
jgi:hypothetical protein